jgi:DNA-binding CsgD family transcriptional regulator
MADDDDSEADRTLKGLSAREREVLKRRFGINASKDLSLEDIERQFKITRERIRAIEERAMKKLGARVYAVSIQITGYVDDHFPGFVSCELNDAHQRKWQFVEKVPVVTRANLTSRSTYPQAGHIRCRVLSRSVGEGGRAITRIDTASPDGVESTDGNTVFDVFSEQVVEVSA